jgi:hypothetical protein
VPDELIRIVFQYYFGLILAVIGRQELSLRFFIKGVSHGTVAQVQCLIVSIA